jgi:CheY-like chemotaxis protein
MSHVRDTLDETGQHRPAFTREVRIPPICTGMYIQSASLVDERWHRSRIKALLIVQAADARTQVDAAMTGVLVVDDDPTTLELIRSVLEADGYAAFAASGGAEALQILRSTPGILLAISDINMPEMDGISFLERANALAGPSSPRVIFVTAYPSVDYAVAALRLGAIDFLTKPVRPHDLLSAVRNAVVSIQRERAISSLPEQAATLAQQAESLAATLKGLAQGKPQDHIQPGPAPSRPQPAEARGALRDIALLGLDHLRRLRRSFPPLAALDDVAWDLLRELLLAEKKSQRLSVSSLSVTVEDVSSTTALRRIQELVKTGHIVRNPDPTDARRDFVALAPEIRETLEKYLERVAQELAVVAAAS